MVAITAVLAAVIAVFVLDFGSSIGQEAPAGVNMQVDSNNESRLTATWASQGNAAYANINGRMTVQDSIPSARR